VQKKRGAKKDSEGMEKTTMLITSLVIISKPGGGGPLFHDTGKKERSQLSKKNPGKKLETRRKKSQSKTSQLHDAAVKDLNRA